MKYFRLVETQTSADSTLFFAFKQRLLIRAYIRTLESIYKSKEIIKKRLIGLWLPRKFTYWVIDIIQT
jgi:hypothetical protein